MTPTFTYYRDSTGQWWSFSINPVGSAETIEVVPQGSTLPTPTFSFYEDSTGQWWSFNINPDGSAETTAVAPPTPGPTPGLIVNTASTIRLIDTMEWAKKFIGNRSTAIGNFLEPALTSASIIMQTMMGAPFRWRWNRVITGFMTQAGQQDYYIFNWTATTAIDPGWVLVDINGNCQQAQSGGTTGAFYPTWNSVVGGTTLDGTGSGTVTWLNTGHIGVPLSITYDFGWIETASVKDPTLGKWVEIEQKICLASDAVLARPRFVAAQGDDGSGNISFRVMPAPDISYPVTITIQQQPQLFTGVQQTWAPIPDTYSDIYNWGFLAHMLLFADDPRFQLANQKFVTAIIGRNQGLDQSELNIFLNNWQEITGQPVSKATYQAVGNQARGV